MFRGTGAVAAALGGYYNRIALLSLVNALAFVYSIPLALLAFGLAALSGHLVAAPIFAAILLGVLPNPCAAGLQYCAHLWARGDLLMLGDFSAGLRRYWRPAAAMFGLSVASLVVILGNLAFYGHFTVTIAVIARLIWLYLLILWFGTQIYVYPLLFSVEPFSLRLIYKNALIIAATRPVPTLIVGAVWLAWLFLSSATGIVVVAGLIVAALVQQGALVRLVPTFEQR